MVRPLSGFFPSYEQLRRLSLRAAIVGLFVIAVSLASAVILFSTGDPTQNTTAPTSLLANSGWQFEGSFGSFLGTPIDAHHFITVQHIGVQSNTFVYQGANYTVGQWFDDTQSDLRIYEVAETFPNYAPIYARSDELGRSLVVIGRGTQRGDPLLVGGIIRGWNWGTSDGVQRWGESQVDELQGVYLHCLFNQNAGPNESDLSSGDSGGAAFTNDNGTWKLVGIHYGVDGPFAYNAGDPTFNAALFDIRDLFDTTLGYVISGSAPVPSGFYSIRLSQRLSWIVSIAPGATPPAPTPTPTPVPASSPTLAQLTSPVPGAVLAGARTSFSWSAGSASYFKLWVGSSPGLSNIYTSGKTTSRSVTAVGLPINGRTVYVRLLSLVRSTWQWNDYTFTAFSAGSSTPTPTPSSSPTPSATPRGGRGGGGGGNR